MIEPLPQTFAEAPSAAPESARGATILVVEDEPELAEILEYNLRRNGYAVRTAGDGLSALRLLAAERPELVLLDIMLPDLDGWEVCRRVRQHADPTLASTPIIMLTALGTLDHRLKGLGLGADAYLPKPYVVREVLLCARTLIARSRRAQELSLELRNAREGERLRAEMQAMLFHELRNQMVVVGGYSRLLLKEETGGTRARAYMEAVSRSSEHLARLAEELLRAAQFSTGTLTLSSAPLPPARIIDEVIGLMAPLARQQGARIEPSVEECIVLANEQALRLILSSLLENALKYGGCDNLVRVRCAEREGRICLEVEDRGPGIDPEEAALIFEKDYRGRQHAGRIPGTGMGLYAARTLAAVMDGELELRSPSGKGSCFVLWLPAAMPAPVMN